MSVVGRRAGVLAIAAVVVVTWLVYAPVGQHEFLNYDDDEYVTENLAVRGGLTVEGVRWAATSTHQATWHPLTSVSHMLDVELFGLDAGWHLRVNVLLHVLASVVLFAVLRQMTSASGPSALVAGLFALHPLHVESVAWVSERKDVLSGLLWMVTLWRYARYVHRPTWSRYAGLLVVFALALLAKPMVVTLPCVLLLLDAWPLDRAAARGWRALIVEKLPLFVMAVVVSGVTLVVQQRAGALATLASVPLGPRVANALVAYARYLRKTIWPVDLAVFYPFDAALPPSTIVGAVVVLGAISAWAVALRHRRRYVLVGWLWFLGTLVPVIGLVRQGEQAMADRFTYVPLVGLFIAVVWGLTEVLGRRRRLLAGLGIAALAACAVLTAQQVRHWESSEALFRHALAVTSGNYLAHTNLGVALTRRGQEAEAMRHFAEALRLEPGYAKAQLNYGRALAERGEWEVAAARYAEALRLDPRYAPAEYNWGLLLAEQEEYAAAIVRYDRAIALDPRYARAYNNRGWSKAALGRYAEAVDDYRAALRLAPDLPAAHNNLAVALEEIGEPDAAIEHYAHAVRLTPDDPKARYNLAAALLGRDRAAEAIVHYRVVVRLVPDMIEARYGLAVALGGAGRVDDALEAGEQAAALARSAGRIETAGEIEGWMRRYRAAPSSAAR